MLIHHESQTEVDEDLSTLTMPFNLSYVDGKSWIFMKR